jgi:hypothetical protein
MKNYYLRNREKYITRSKIYYRLHKEKCIAYTKEYERLHPFKKLLHNIRQRCRNKNDKKYKYYGGKGVKCLLTDNDLEFLWTRDKAWLLKEPSIDRKDNNKNYVLTNCQFIEMSVNRIKRG